MHATTTDPTTEQTTEQDTDQTTVPIRIDRRFLGCMARLRPTAVAVYVALASHADGSGRCWPAIARLAEISGLSRSTVKRALGELQAQGAVRIVERGGPAKRKRSTTHTFRVLVDAERTGGSADQTVGAERSKAADRRATDDPAGGSAMTPPRATADPTGGSTMTHQRATADPSTGHGRTPNLTSESNQESRPVNQPAAGDRSGGSAERAGARSADRSVAGEAAGGVPRPVASGATLAALTRAGVGEPMRSRLARLPGVDAERVRQVAERVRSTGGGVGLIVTRLRERAAEEQGRAAHRRRAEAARRWWAGLSEAEQRRWHRALIDRHPNLQSTKIDFHAVPVWAAKLRDELNGDATAEG